MQLDIDLPGLGGSRWGTFIAFEGGDCVGKTTQIKALCAKLQVQAETSSREVLVVREPGGTAAGEQIRQLLLHKTDCPLSLRAEVLLFLASRVQLYVEQIAPALARNAIVISDRYHLSTLVYQGWAAHRPAKPDHCNWLMKLVESAIGAQRPDLNVVLQLEWAETQRRLPAAGSGDRFEERVQFQEGLWQAFQECPGLVGDKIVRVDASGSELEVAQRVWQEVQNVL